MSFSITINWYYLLNQQKDLSSQFFCSWSRWWKFKFYVYRLTRWKLLMVTYIWNIQVIPGSIPRLINFRTFRIFLFSIWLKSIIFSQMSKTRNNFNKGLKKKSQVHNHNHKIFQHPTFLCHHDTLSIWDTWLTKIYIFLSLLMKLFSLHKPTFT